MRERDKSNGTSGFLEYRDGFWAVYEIYFNKMLEALLPHLANGESLACLSCSRDEQGVTFLVEESLQPLVNLAFQITIFCPFFQVYALTFMIN